MLLVYAALLILVTVPLAGGSLGALADVRLRAAGLVPEAVSQGIGPRWDATPNASLQQGAGMRAAFLLRAEKRVTPLTPIRSRPALRVPTGVPAA